MIRVDIGLEKYRRRFFTPFELLSLEENGGMSEFSDHSLAPESLFALTVQCRDWLDRSASSEGDDFVEKEEEAEKELLPDHRPLDVIIDQMVRPLFSLNCLISMTMGHLIATGGRDSKVALAGESRHRSSTANIF